jgi:hypothetical protein
LAARFQIIFVLFGLLAGGCTTVAFPPDYSPSKVHVGSRSTPREALELCRYAIWEEQTGLAYPILSEKTRAEGGPLSFWVALGFTFPPCETDENIKKEDWITNEEFLKFFKIAHIPSRWRTRQQVWCKLMIEFGDGYYSPTYHVLLLRERDGWAVGLKEMMDKYSEQ